MITPPTLPQLEAGKALVWALDTGRKQLEQTVGTVETMALVVLLTMPGEERFHALQRVPQFLWAYNIFDNYGVQKLRAAVKQYDERSKEDHA